MLDNFFCLGAELNCWQLKIVFEQWNLSFTGYCFTYEISTNNGE